MKDMEVNEFMDEPRSTIIAKIAKQNNLKMRKHMFVAEETRRRSEKAPEGNGCLPQAARSLPRHVPEGENDIFKQAESNTK